MSACDHDRLLQLVDGELPAPERERLEQHLTDCEGCWQALHRLRAARAALGTLRETAAGPHELGVDFGRVQARIRAELDEKPRRPARRGWSRRPRACAPCRSWCRAR